MLYFQLENNCSDYSTGKKQYLKDIYGMIFLYIKLSNVEPYQTLNLQIFHIKINGWKSFHLTIIMSPLLIVSMWEYYNLSSNVLKVKTKNSFCFLWKGSTTTAQLTMKPRLKHLHVDSYVTTIEFLSVLHLHVKTPASAECCDLMWTQPIVFTSLSDLDSRFNDIEQT